MERSKNFLEFWLFAVGRLRISVVFSAAEKAAEENQKSKCKNVEARCAGGIFLAFWRRLVRIRVIQLEAGEGKRTQILLVLTLSMSYYGTKGGTLVFLAIKYGTVLNF